MRVRIEFANVLANAGARVDPGSTGRVGGREEGRRGGRRGGGGGINGDQGVAFRYTIFFISLGALDSDATHER